MLLLNKVLTMVCFMTGTVSEKANYVDVIVYAWCCGGSLSCYIEIQQMNGDTEKSERDKATEEEEIKNQSQNERILNNYLHAQSEDSGKMILKLKYEKEKETIDQKIWSYDDRMKRMMKAENVSKMLKRIQRSEFEIVTLNQQMGIEDIYSDSPHRRESLNYWIRRAAAQLIQRKEEYLDKDQIKYPTDIVVPSNNKVNDENIKDLAIGNVECNEDQNKQKGNLFPSYQNSNINLKVSQPVFPHNYSLEDYIYTPKTLIGHSNDNENILLSQNCHSPKDQGIEIIKQNFEKVDNITPYHNAYQAKPEIIEDMLSNICGQTVNQQKQESKLDAFDHTKKKRRKKNRDKNGKIDSHQNIDNQQKSELMKQENKIIYQDIERVEKKDCSQIGKFGSDPLAVEKERTSSINVMNQFQLEHFKGVLLVSQNKEVYRRVSIGSTMEGDDVFVVVEMRKDIEHESKVSELRLLLSQYETLYKESLNCLKQLCHNAYLEIPKLCDNDHRQSILENKNDSLHLQLKIIINKIVNLKDLLQLQRPKKIKLIPQEIDLLGLLEELASDFKPLLDERGITFDLRMEKIGTIYNSPKRVKQVLFNIIHNAIQYAKKDYAVHMFITYHPTIPQLIRFHVINMMESPQQVPHKSALLMNMNHILHFTQSKKKTRSYIQTGLRVSNKILSLIGPKNTLVLKLVDKTLQIQFHIYADSSQQESIILQNSPTHQKEDVDYDSWIQRMECYKKEHQTQNLERKIDDNKLQDYFLTND